MVKSIIYTAAAIALCAALFIFTEHFVKTQFGEVERAASALYEKVESGDATEGDAQAVYGLWEQKKSRLHIFIPHNDIAQLDYYLGEAGGHIRNGENKEALAKLEVVKRGGARQARSGKAHGCLAAVGICGEAGKHILNFGQRGALSAKKRARFQVAPVRYSYQFSSL